MVKHYRALDGDRVDVRRSIHGIMRAQWPGEFMPRGDFARTINHAGKCIAHEVEVVQPLAGMAGRAVRVEVRGDCLIEVR